MDEKELQEAVSEQAQQLDVPGVAVAVYAGGEAHYAFHGVTSVENPLPVDETTLFQFGSTGKTYTATAMLRLVEQGEVDLDAPVRRYLPEFKLKDPSVAEQVTVIQLFNHTAGWAGDLMTNTGDGDDALEKYVALMADIDQVRPLGAGVSYNNAALSVAGHIIARVTGKTYEAAVKELLLDPLGMKNTFFFMNDIMTRRFAVGHRQDPDGTIKVARPWALARGNAPAGGLSANAEDQVAWARFHLGDGRAGDGTRLLSEELLKRMQEPTVEMKGSAIGDYVGISWLLADIGDVRVVGHGGTTNGQYSDFDMVPSRDFAYIAMTNCGPNGSQFKKELRDWVFERYLGIREEDPEPIDATDEQLRPYTGTFETIAVTCAITAEKGRLSVDVQIKPEALAELREQGEDEPEEQPPIPLGLLPGDGDRYVVTDGPAKGMKGYFVRDDRGEVSAVHMGGRLATRSSSPL